MKFLFRLFSRSKRDSNAWSEKETSAPPSGKPSAFITISERRLGPLNQGESSQSLKTDSGWDVERPERSGIERPKDFVVFDNLTDVAVAGTHHADGCKAWLIAARAAARGGRGWPTLRLQRDPENPFDPNAVRVLGVLPNGKTETMLGYLPADVAGAIADRFDPAMPIAAILRAAGTSRDGTKTIAAVEVLIPRKADRKAFER